MASKPASKPAAKASKTPAKAASALPKNALPKIKAIVGREILDSRSDTSEKEFLRR